MKPTAIFVAGFAIAGAAVLVVATMPAWRAPVLAAIGVLVVSLAVAIVLQERGE